MGMRKSLNVFEILLLMTVTAPPGMGMRKSSIPSQNSTFLTTIQAPPGPGMRE
jgi:hypothetical protein